MFGPCIAGPLLAWLGHIEGSDHYSYPGYVALMGCGGTSEALSPCVCLLVTACDRLMHRQMLHVRYGAVCEHVLTER